MKTGETMRLQRHIPTFVAFLAILVLADSSARAQEIEAYQIRSGTLEINGWSYIFRSGPTVETFNWLLNSGVTEPGRPGPRGLREIGFRTKSGDLHEYLRETKDQVVKRVMEKRPEEKIVSLIFEGKSGHRVEIKLEGRTPVYRVDLRIADVPVILWSNVADDSKQKDK